MHAVLESAIEVSFRFSIVESHPAIEGTLRGTIVMTCQRCMQSVRIALDESFQVLIVRAERADEPGGYEPVIADPARLDLRWLAEEQALLALPLVPMHESQACEATAGEASSQVAADEPRQDEVRQQPFENLRDLLRRG